MKERDILEYIFIYNPQHIKSRIKDNIGIAKMSLPKGIRFCDGERKINIVDDVPAGAIISLDYIPKGGDIVSFGIKTGVVKRAVRPGELIKDGVSGNVKVSRPHRSDTHAGGNYKSVSYDSSLLKRTFKGFRCKVTLEGEEGAGTENIVAVLSTVNCCAQAAKNIAYKARKELLPKYSNVTDVVAITQESGCGMPEGQARDELLKILIRIMNNPNIRAVYLLGLGCEHLTPCIDMPGNISGILRSKVIDFDERVRIGTLQKYKSEIEAIRCITTGPLKELFSLANRYRREPFSLSHLTLGLKCGGSDIFSGICSNPVLGFAADKLIQAGGAAILTETTELEGVMHLLVERARNRNVARQLNNLLQRFRRLSGRYPIPGSGRQSVAPGNKDGGLFNILIKSAVAVQKSGTRRIEGVLEYGDSVYEHKSRGLWVLNCPSYDQISTPALGLSGSQIVAFTTGLGTPMGSAFSQVVKIGNRRQIGLKGHVDFFTDKILKGKSVEEVGNQLFEFIIAVASGDIKTSVSRINAKMYKSGFPELHNEFMLWKRWGDN